jgi:guanylate kinase
MNDLMPVVIVSGPSGSGKSTVIAKALASVDVPVRLSVSATTRSPRSGEIDGTHYHFWTHDRFQSEVARGEFLEWAKVHDHCYGTLKREVDPYRSKGVVVVLDIDVQGAQQLRASYPDAVTVFVRTSCLSTYEDRLRKRGTESEAAVQKRVIAARGELAHADEYEHQLVNDDLESAVAELRGIIQETVQRASHVG